MVIQISTSVFFQQLLHKVLLALVIAKKQSRDDIVQAIFKTGNRMRNGQSALEPDSEPLQQPTSNSNIFNAENISQETATMHSEYNFQNELAQSTTNSNIDMDSHASQESILNLYHITNPEGISYQIPTTCGEEVSNQGTTLTFFDGNLDSERLQQSIPDVGDIHKPETIIHQIPTNWSQNNSTDILTECTSLQQRIPSFDSIRYHKPHPKFNFKSTENTILATPIEYDLQNTETDSAYGSFSSSVNCIEPEKVDSENNLATLHGENNNIAVLKNIDFEIVQPSSSANQTTDEGILIWGKDNEASFAMDQVENTNSVPEAGTSTTLNFDIFTNKSEGVFQYLYD
ncbi:uncharacterized protein LOC115885767 [Sitophilus oryzae]|uniref:Uncharacterized protein LOC115885767 n=1 Tax=Sitophilus oryzae TaxID=7048 RepID=A0A6J2Y9U2_SITOR|nr:uncharacterized protein LOC115885767 [Sitophilus oryzae]